MVLFIYLFIIIIIIIYFFYRGHFESCCQQWEGLELRIFGRKGVGNEVGGSGVRALGAESANSENSGKIRSERLRRFCAPDFAPASQNLNGPSESTTLRVDKLSLYSGIGYNTVDCESTVR